MISPSKGFSGVSVHRLTFGDKAGAGRRWSSQAFSDFHNHAHTWGRL